MNEIIKAMLNRRSIRKYEDKPVPENLIHDIVEAGLYAASSMGRQNTKIIAITNEELRRDLSELNNQIGGWPAGNDPFYGAPVVILVLGKKGEGKEKYDGSLVIGNMMLAAYALGLGSCWIHRAKEELTMPLGKKILDQVGLSADEWEGIGHCIIGYPAEKFPKAALRKPDRVYYLK